MKAATSLAREWHACTYAEHMDAKHKVKFGKRRNCEENPLCFYGLGEFKSNVGIWGPTNNLRAIQMLQQKTSQYAVERRDPATQPAGFPNLGATCYMNSLLQSLFHNDKFRELVYKYRPDDSSPTSSSSLSLAERRKHAYELQRLFCELDLSTRASIDPSSFVQLLQLETQIQQDVQEFNKLLLDHLCNAMDSPQLVQLFQGEQRYTNKCVECENEFHSSEVFLELLLPLKNEVDIASCLSTYVKPEKLSGDNQYYCSTCARHVNAERRLEISKFPPVLNLQLTRFVFDANSLTKRKTKESIAIPDELEVAPGVWYDLKAVLFHKGQSANAGHYVAEILCGDGEWWIFNDNAVERRQTSKRANATKNSSSGDAYMVIYHQRNGAEVAQEEETGRSLLGNVDCRATAPPELVQSVLRDNEQYSKDQDFLLEQRHRVELAAEARRETYEQVFLSDALDLRVNTRVWVPTAWLVSWIQGEPQPSPGELFQEAPTFTDFLCPHGKLDLLQARLGMKLIPLAVYRAAATPVRGSDELQVPPELCAECAQTLNERDSRRREEMTELQAMDAILLAPAPTDAEEDTVWISRSFIKLAREGIKRRIAAIKDELSLQRHKKPRLETEDGNANALVGGTSSSLDANADLVCEHGVMLANCKALRRLMLRRDWDRLLLALDKGKWKEGSTLLPKQDSSKQCASCEQARKQAEEWMLADRALVHSSEFGTALQQVLGRTCGYPPPCEKQPLIPVPRFFMDALRDYMSGRSEDAPPAPMNLSMLSCTHGRLVLNPRALDFLHHHPTTSSSQPLLVPEENEEEEASMYGVEVEFVTADEWRAIDRIASHGLASNSIARAPITITRRAMGGNQTAWQVTSSPPLCFDCCDTLREAFQRDKREYVDRAVFCTNLARNQQQERLRVVVSSSDTLYVLKKRLAEACKATAPRRTPPFDANAYVIFHCGSKFEDMDDCSLEALGICAGDDIHFSFDPAAAAAMAALFSSGGELHNNATGGSNERGFTGTALVNSFSPSPVPIPPPPAPVVVMDLDEV